MKKCLIALILISSITFTGCVFTAGNRGVKETLKESQETSSQEAKTTPFGKYPDTLTYTLGKMTGDHNSNMPEGDTYEDNAYTRLLKKQLNIQNKDVFEVKDNYSANLSMVIASKNLPDLMVVDNEAALQELVEHNMIEDLSQVYEDCASKRIKDIYASYGSDILNNVTFDGKLMAIPETNIDNGPDLIWLRKDWMDKLGLEAPETVEDLEQIIQAFITLDPGNNGKGNTVGLACISDLTAGGGYTAEYQTNILFASCNAFPKQWIKNKDGDIVYGSIQPEAKQGLKYLRDLYERGIIDRDFLLREDNNIIDMVVSGNCGSFFGPWWAPNNPLMSAMEENPDADWEPYLIQTSKDGYTEYSSQKLSNRYVVVRKGYEHPELAVKILNVLFSGATYGEKGYNEIETYYQKNVDPTARPLTINVDYKDALNRCYTELQKKINAKIDLSDMGLLEGSYAISCERYQQETKGEDTQADSKEAAITELEDWAAYTSRIKACSLLTDSKTREVPSLYFGETKTMKTRWWKLEEMEKEAYLQIITGEKDLDYFDEFVEQWNDQGGNKITQEVRLAVAESDNQK